MVEKCNYLEKENQQLRKLDENQQLIEQIIPIVDSILEQDDKVRLRKHKNSDDYASYISE